MVMVIIACSEIPKEKKTLDRKMKLKTLISEISSEHVHSDKV